MSNKVKQAGFAHHSDIGQQITFNWFEDDGSIDLGTPNSIKVVPGNGRDGGCQLRFTSSQHALDGKSLALYFYGAQVTDLTVKLWQAYNAFEPEAAKREFVEALREISKFMKPAKPKKIRRKRS